MLDLTIEDKEDFLHTIEQLYARRDNPNYFDLVITLIGKLSSRSDSYIKQRLIELQFQYYYEPFSRYIDIPVQYVNQTVQKRMRELLKRKPTKEEKDLYIQHRSFCRNEAYLLDLAKRELRKTGRESLLRDTVTIDRLKDSINNLRIYEAMDKYFADIKYLDVLRGISITGDKSFIPDLRNELNYSVTHFGKDDKYVHDIRDLMARLGDQEQINYMIDTLGVYNIKGYKSEKAFWKYLEANYRCDTLVNYGEYRTGLNSPPRKKRPLCITAIQHLQQFIVGLPKHYLIDKSDDDMEDTEKNINILLFVAEENYKWIMENKKKNKLVLKLD